MIDKVTLLRAARNMAETIEWVKKEAELHGREYVIGSILHMLTTAAEAGELAVERVISERVWPVYRGQGLIPLELLAQQVRIPYVNWEASLVDREELIRWVVETHNITDTDTVTVKKTIMQREREPGMTLNRLCKEFRAEHGRLPTKDELYQSALKTKGTQRFGVDISLMTDSEVLRTSTTKTLKSACARAIDRADY